MVISGGVRHQPNEVSNVLCGMPGILSAPWGTLEPSCTLFLRNPSYMSRLLTQLENARYQFGPASAADLTKLLARAARTHFNDTASLIRLHEALLVFRAFPPSPTVLRLTTNLLGTFHLRVDRLRARAADMDDFDPLEVSGIAGTVMQDSISYDLARWLLRRLPGKVEIAWDDFHHERAMAAVFPRLMPLLEDDSLTEADTPWRKWFDTSQGSKTSSPRWLITQIDLLPLSGPDKSHLYDSLRVPLRWHLENSPLSRTRNTRPVREVFYHREPLLTRKDFSLTEELSRTPPKFTRLSRTQGEAVIDLIREVMLVRYRELYGTTLGDPRSVVRADLGRGVSVFLWNLPPERRLPLRAYTAGLTLKNGVPINYIEALALFEWMEVGFNTFYTFRGGEVAWTFAQVLRCLTHLMGTRCVSMYPYQLGYNNEEAIESGALWFYRKLGFRPGHPDLLRLIQREEQRIARDPKYRTPAATLRRLAAGHMFYELPGAQPGAWDRFSTRNLGLRAAGLMSRDFGGNLQHFRDASARRLSKILRIPPPNPAASLQPNPINPAATSFHNFAMLAALIPDLPAWTPAEKESLLEILRAKGAPSEMRYLHLLQTHSRLRDALLRLGSRT